MSDSMRRAWERRKRKGPNHKVVYIRDAGYEEVFDFTVSGDHNARLDNGVFVHNCHFTILQEYLAARLGVAVDKYHHFSNNLHVYCDRGDWRPQELLVESTAAGSDAYTSGKWNQFTKLGKPLVTVPLVEDPALFEKELPLFVERYSGGETYSPCSWQEPFLNNVAGPMLTAYRAYKEDWGGGWRMWVDQIASEDWQLAARNWIERRVAKKEATVND